MSRASVAVMVLSVAGLGAWVGGARAQECTGDTGCPKGFSCQVTAVSSCAAGAPTPDCGPNETCTRPAMQPLPPPMCETKEYRSCVPAECMSDSDCATGMVCHTEEASDCAGAAESDLPCKDGICPPREPPPDCTTKVKHQCVPRYLLPCEQASDCGEGFTCEAQKRCGCSAGSAGTPSSGQAPPVDAAKPAPQDGGQGDREPAADAGVPADLVAPPPPDCTCEVTAEKYCKAVEVVCKADSDCPGDFTCQVTATSGSSGGSGGAAATCPMGSCPALPAPPPPVEERRCVPPYDGVAVDLGGVPTRGGETTGAGGKSGSVDHAPTAPPAALPGGDNPSAHSRSCSVASPGTRGTGSLALWASLMTLAAALFLTLRRR
ncbi:MAG TPA: hypothetical protein VJV78_06570 [Polyangiales bacterium]|nr:hypothetical protein [Polyangiales bacterium]